MKDFSYAKERAYKAHKKKWYVIGVGKYSCYIWSLPLVPFVWIYDKWKEYLWESCKWNEKMAAKVLDCALPHFLDYDAENNEYSYCSKWNYAGWNFAKHVSIGLKTFTRKFIREIKDYLFNEYQKDGYEKWLEKPDMFDREVYVVFKKIDCGGTRNEKI